MGLCFGLRPSTLVGFLLFLCLLSSMRMRSPREADHSPAWVDMAHGVCPTATHTLGSTARGSRALGQDLGGTLPLQGGQGQPQHPSLHSSCISSKATTNLVREHSPEPGEAISPPRSSEALERSSASPSNDAPHPQPDTQHPPSALGDAACSPQPHVPPPPLLLPPMAPSTILHLHQHPSLRQKLNPWCGNQPSSWPRIVSLGHYVAPIHPGLKV